MIKLDRRTKPWRNRYMTLGKITLGVLIALVMYAILSFSLHPRPLISPLSDVQPVPEEMKVQIVEDYKNVGFGFERIKVEAVEPQEVTGQKWTGTASWYSRDGCIGCSANLHMANGQPLDDNALTVAFNRLPLGRKVRVTNSDSMMTVIAVITDTGGFERHGRIIDITPKVRDLINCGGLCEVVVTEILE